MGEGDCPRPAIPASMDAAERAAAEELLRSTPWVSELIKDLSEPKIFDGMFQKDASLRPQHFVIGQRSPFIFKGPHVSGGGRQSVATWAVYAGHYSINGSYMLQGGAISAIFDYVTACMGSAVCNPGSFALTKSAKTQFLHGANPVPGVFRVTCEVFSLDEESGSMHLKSSLSNDKIEAGGRPFAISECEMVDGPRRKAWKAKQRQEKAVSPKTASANVNAASVGNLCKL